VQAAWSVVTLHQPLPACLAAACHYVITYNELVSVPYSVFVACVTFLQLVPLPTEKPVFFSNASVLFF
jgi:hypothetical protein